MNRYIVICFLLALVNLPFIVSDPSRILNWLAFTGAIFVAGRASTIQSIESSKSKMMQE